MPSFFAGVLLLLLLPRLAFADTSCDAMPGNWSGFDDGQAVDRYAVDWAPERGIGAFDVNLTSNNERWHVSLCHLGADNATASCFFPELNATIRGTSTYGCRNLLWDNGSTWRKDQKVSKVHLLWMSHLDVGFTDLINEVHNSYLIYHYPRALALAAAMRANASTSDRFSYVTHPWLLSLYLDCPSNFTLSGVTLLCPNATQVAEMKAAVAMGDIQYHAAPFNVEWEGVAYPEFALTYFALAKNLSTVLDVPPPRTASCRDVPGVTRSLLPVLAAAGVTRLSEGCNPVTQPPAMPSPSIWRDAASGAQVLYVQHSYGYGLRNALANEVRVPLGEGLGDATCAMVPGWGEVLCFNFRGEGQGPPGSLKDVIATFASFRSEFPGADVFTSSFDAYFDALETISASLPVVTKEAGDSWINGYAGDPSKMALYRIAARAYSECARAGECDLSDARLAAFSRYALKPGGIPEFFAHENSWLEQRNVTAVYALAALADHPLGATIAQRLAEATPQRPVPGSDYALVPVAQWTHPLSVALPGGGSVSLAFDGSAGGLTLLSVNGSANLAVPSRPLAALVYREFNGTDWLAATTCPQAYQRYGDDDAGARSATTRATMDALYVQGGAGPRSFLVHATLPEALVQLRGAPVDIWVNFSVAPTGDLAVDVQLFSKTSTRFGEAITLEYLFAPGALAPADGTWRLDKLGSWVDPLDGVSGGSTQQHAVGSGVGFFSPARGPTAGGVFLDTLDAPVVCPATGDTQEYTTLPLSSLPLEGPVTGWASLLFTNAWAMNFPLWSLDVDLRFRFGVRVVAAPPA